ncbi:MAG: histidinol-phosphate transaminase [Janthinobacterium lividum]
MNQFWSPVVHSLTPYVPGEQPKIAGLVKLNTNENPYGPSPAVARAIAAEIEDADAKLRLYPDPEAGALKEAIARYYGVSAREVFVGNGSDEVLAHTFRALLDHGAPVLFPDVTYSFYPVYCQLFGIPYTAIEVSETLAIDVSQYAAACGGVILPNPNAPSGIGLPLSEIERLVASQPTRTVVIDEAYVDFGAETAIPLTRRYPNLLVVQTLSKSRSLAGLRVGFAIGNAGLIEALERVKNSFNSYPLGRPAIVGAIAAFEDDAWFDKTRQQVIATRRTLTDALTAAGFEVLPSSANFVFARHPGMAGAALAAALREKAVLVRHFRSPRIENYLRITVGTDAQCAALMQALAEILP